MILFYSGSIFYRQGLHFGWKLNFPYNLLKRKTRNKSVNKFLCMTPDVMPLQDVESTEIKISIYTLKIQRSQKNREDTKKDIEKGSRLFQL